MLQVGDYFRSLLGPWAGWAHSVLFSADLRYIFSYCVFHTILVSFLHYHIAFSQACITNRIVTVTY